jgi:hypothetical protein
MFGQLTEQKIRPQKITNSMFYSIDLLMGPEPKTTQLLQNATKKEGYYIPANRHPSCYRM